jgi:hypothetical protein
MFGSFLEQLAVWIVTGGSRPFHQTGEMDQKNKLLSTELLKNRSARMEATFLVVVIQQVLHSFSTTEHDHSSVGIAINKSKVGKAS